MTNMFNRFKEHLRRAMSFELLQPLPPQEPAPPQGCMKEEESPRKLRRAAAIGNLKPTSGRGEPEHSPRTSLRTPQHKLTISRKEYNTASDDALRAILFNDGSSVRQPSGTVLSIKDGISSSPGNEATPFNRLPGSYYIAVEPRQSSASTVIIHRPERDGEDHETSNDELMSTVCEETAQLSTSSQGAEYSVHEQGRKRARSVLRDITNDAVDEETHPRKRLRKSLESSLSGRSSSPSPPHKNYTARVKTTPRLVQSQPGLTRTRRESIENDATLTQGRKFSRRVWSAEDVLHALHIGRVNAENSTDNTPPSSPLISPLPVPMQQCEHTLPSPKVRLPKLKREPLSNITDNFVPDFLQAPEPEIRVDLEPPTPGGTWNCHLESMQRGDVGDKAESESMLLGFDGTMDSKLVNEEIDLDQHSCASFSSTLSDDLENTSADGRPKQPIITHVLHDLDNDARFLQDALDQVKSLRAKVSRHDIRARRAKEWLDGNKSPTTEEAKAKAKDRMAQYLREAKACEEAAERAKAESSEYRRKAKELLENAMTEVAMLRDHDGETDVGRGEGGDEDDIIE